MELYYIKGLLKDHKYRNRIASNIPITFFSEKKRDVRDYLNREQFDAYKLTFPLDNRTYERQDKEPPQPRNYFTVFLGELLTKKETDEILRFLKTQPDFLHLHTIPFNINKLEDFYKFGFVDRVNDNKGEFWRFNHKGTKNVFFRGYADYKDHIEHDYSPNAETDLDTDDRPKGTE